ncbi:MAG: MerR family transcriptional regulator [Actinomycetota bacterium]|nr:MerR family transcriptional regulator [Actinomycetota bacterium]
MTITELAARTGLASSALRFYERKGLLRPVGRIGGKRTYSPDAVDQLALIDLLKLAGFTLTEVAALIDTNGQIVPGWRRQAHAKLGELDDRLGAIRQARTSLAHALECSHESLQDCPTHQRLVRRHAKTLRDRSRKPLPDGVRRVTKGR